MRGEIRVALAPRPELVREPVTAGALGVVEKPLSGWERVANITALRKVVLLVALALVWEAYARWLNNPLLLPTFSATLDAFAGGFASGSCRCPAGGCRSNS